MPIAPVIKRHRLTLRDKKAVIERYNYFLSTVVIDEDGPPLLFNPYDGMTEERYEKSIKMFLNIENKLWPDGYKLDMSNVFKWVKASQRGEYLEWGGFNDLDKPNCRSKALINHIDNLLRQKHKTSAVWNQLVKSPSSPDKYGVIAREDIPSGTFLGYYQGEYFTSDDPVKGLNIFKISGNHYINASKEHTSCYARHYNWSTLEKKQNVTVQRLSSRTADPNKTICFIANVEIKQGVELIIGHDQGYLKTSNNKRYKTCKSNYTSDVEQRATQFDLCIV
jgi:hypothetical protein